MSLLIKKRVDLDFLGKDFKDTYLVFKSIPAKDLPEIMEISKTENTVGVIPKIVSLLEKYYIEGKHQGEAVKKEELSELDANSVVHCFEVITGQSSDPKAEAQSNSISSTEAQPQ